MDILTGIVLFLICAILLVAEVFIPSFGMLGILATLSLIGGVYKFFQHGNLAGIIGIVAAVIMVPAVLISGYRIMPRTRFGKNVILTGPKQQQGDGVPDVEKIRQLVGRVGVVASMLRPVGVVRFGDLKVECVAESGYVDKDMNVIVIKVDGTQVTVRKI